MMGILSISAVSKHFGGLTVLDGVDMEIKQGKLYQLIGPNGSGKTTLINVVSGLLKPDDGKIIFDGNDITQKGLFDTYKTGLIRTWQIPQPFNTLTTMENFLISSSGNAGESFLMAPLRSKWKNDEKRITDLLFSYCPDLMEAYSLSIKLTQIFNTHQSKDAALIKFNEWIRLVGRSKLSCFNTFIKTLRKWKNEIANYFVGRNTSAFVEGLNNKIKVLKRRCYGIYDLKHFFQRLFLDISGYDLYATNIGV